MSSAEIADQREPVRTRASWRPADIADADEWTVVLSDDERTELVAAVATARRSGTTVTSVDAATFPLTTLAGRVEEWSALLNEGRGFLLLRGFPVDLLDPPDVELAYIGLGTHLGTPVGQDRDATVLGHVRDEGVERTHPGVRFYRTRERQDFHADGADLVGLLCLQRARTGGESRIVSSAAVYNEILEQRPDLLEVLYRPFHWDRNDEESPGEDPFFSMPVLNDIAGTPRVFYIGWYIRDAQRHAQVPRLTPEQLEAMELLEAIANDPAFFLEMDFQPGDVQFLNNARILHAREAYEDHEDPSRRRHLLRLWLAAHRFTSVDEVLQGGIPRQDPADVAGER
ncbi:TauD/TfdA family dioxygenase [Aquihabitans daechungensis]|uniref:TauD/TfdA family dioxygenase n=1 Tax=Aquihabitans daechungensis TaxID=1052257 RepID=UPI003BA37896